jgi:hypothetical protein
MQEKRGGHIGRLRIVVQQAEHHIPFVHPHPLHTIQNFSQIPVPFVFNTLNHPVKRVKPVIEPVYTR